MSKPEWQSIGEQFLTSYFGGNDSNHYSMFYRDDSLLSVDNDKYLGTNDIVAKLTATPTKLKVDNHEIQPSTNGILIFLSGFLTLEGENNAIGFTRVFFLTPHQQSFYIRNDMYKLMLG